LRWRLDVRWWFHGFVVFPNEVYHRTIATEGRGATIKFGSHHDQSKATIDIKSKGDVVRNARPLPKPSPRVPPRVTSSSLDYRVVMQILLSLLLVCASLYVVLAAHYDPTRNTGRLERSARSWVFGFGACDRTLPLAATVQQLSCYSANICSASVRIPTRSQVPIEP
jgi:hypothetical protein